MKKAVTVLFLAFAAACGGPAQTTNAPVGSIPDVSQLTNGMPLVEFQKALGMPGRPRENSTPEETVYDFDFNGEWIMVEVQTWPRVVKQFRLIKDGLTVEQRQAVRAKKWSEWVEAHQRRPTVLAGTEGAVASPLRAVLEPQTNRPGWFMMHISNSSSNSVWMVDVQEGSGFCGEYYEVTCEREGKRYSSKGNCYYAPGIDPTVVEIAAGQTYDRGIQPGAYLYEAERLPAGQITVTYRLATKAKEWCRSRGTRADLDLTFTTENAGTKASSDSAHGMPARLSTAAPRQTISFTRVALSADQRHQVELAVGEMKLVKITGTRCESLEDAAALLWRSINIAMADSQGATIDSRAAAEYRGFFVFSRLDWAKKDDQSFRSGIAVKKGTAEIYSWEERPAQMQESRPAPGDVKEFVADAVPTTWTDPIFKDFKITQKDMEDILKGWFQVTAERWKNGYSQVVGGERTGRLILKDGRRVKWMVKPGGLAWLEFPDGKRMYLAQTNWHSNK